MNKRPLICTAVALLGSASLASAATTLINLDINNSGGTTFTGVGALGGGTWNGITPTITGIAATALKWSDNTNSTITFSMTPVGGNMNGVFNANTGGDLLRDFAGLHTNSAGSVTLTLSGFTANQSLASIVLYGMNGDGGSVNPNQNASFTIGATTKTTNAVTPTSVLTEGVNYVKFDNIQADGTGKLVITWSNPTGGSGWSSFNGLQLQAVPEPSAALLGGLGVLALLRRRR